MSNDLPFGWYIRPIDPSTASCPSSSSILGTFAIVNVVVTVLSIVSGHKNFTKFVTCNILRGDTGHPWRYMFIFPVGIQLLANLAIAHIMKGAPGYEYNYSSWELMLFFTARPRLTFVGLAIASMVKKPSKKGYDEDDYPWLSSCLSNFIGELVLQLIALYIMGTTVHYGVHSKYYLVWSDEYKSLDHFTHVLYGGAMYYLIAGCVYLLIILVVLFFQNREHFVGRGSENWILVFAHLILATTWLGSWLFWVGFVKTVGDKYVINSDPFLNPSGMELLTMRLLKYSYCPPSLLSQALIWTVFSSVGVMLGVGP
jgi:hypothetical protein